MALRSVLVGVDFSPSSDIALRQAEAIARVHGARLCVVHAVGVTAQGLAQHDETFRPDEPWRRQVHDLMSRARRDLQRLTDSLRQDGVAVTHHLVAGYPDEVLAEEARTRGADLLVVGTHGRTGVDRFLMGSVAERMVRSAPCHVLVARPGTPPEPPRRLLVPTDFSETADYGIELAALLAPSGGALELLHCWTPPPLLAMAEDPDPRRHDLMSLARKHGREKCDRYRREGVTVTFDLVDAEPSQGILDRLALGGVDAVVMGSHGHRGVRRLLIGSVTERVVRHAPVSVYVAHGRA